MNIDSDSTIEFLEALGYSLVRDGSLSAPYWIEKIGQEPLNRIIYILARYDLVKTEKKAKYASISATVKLKALIDDLTDYRISSKIKRYGMKCNLSESRADLVSTPSGIKSTGLIREGFAYSAKQTFRLDIAYLTKYTDLVMQNATKSIAKTMVQYEDIALDEANYKELVEIVINNYIANPHNFYNLEWNISDQRGRSIYQGLRRVFNPVSSKDCRALLISSKSVKIDTKEKFYDIYLFIAELVGSKATSRGSKILAGKIAYKSRLLPTLDADSLHEYVWLERIYDRLDLVYADSNTLWDIPLEMDASMCLAQIEGTVLNSSELLVKTNCVGDKLQDPWNVVNTRRAAAKAVGTPTFYGSNQSPTKLIKDKGLSLDKEELKILKEEFSTGTFSIIKDFKDLLISNMDIDAPTYEAAGWGEIYTVEVNKHKPVGAVLNVYKVWNTTTSRDEVFYIHKPILVPDYARFRTYSATGLVHNLESKVVDGVMLDLKALEEWAISIHDAILCLPGTVTRTSYRDRLESLNKVGHSVLKSYMQSIGATSVKAQLDLVKLLDKVTPNTREFSVNALK
jgi:hypothetical protein